MTDEEGVWACGYVGGCIDCDGIFARGMFIRSSDEMESN